MRLTKFPNYPTMVIYKWLDSQGSDFSWRDSKYIDSVRINMIKREVHSMYHIHNKTVESKLVRFALDYVDYEWIAKKLCEVSV